MKKKILIIEDDAIVAWDIQQILEKNNFEVIGIASSIESAFDLYDEHGIDLILCDINLGKGGSGIDFVKNLKLLKGKTKVIYVSAYSNDDVIQKAFETIPDSYLTKPFTEEQLIVTVKRILLTSRSHEMNHIMPTERELQIIRCIADGLKSHEIAQKLGISFETVQTHRKNILHKYKLGSSAELIAYALKNNWIE
ncbi:MAG: response regulator transcription factor [Chlorobi bacterium]|nr:response regulator transcription factor [Chlorobiota bacterium]